MNQMNESLMELPIPMALLKRLPKTDLHVHLDGSLRPITMLALAEEIGYKLPAGDPRSLRDFMHVTQGRDLVDYLERFEITLALMQSQNAIERIAYELAADAAEENVRYMEVRFCPELNTRGGLTDEQVVDAVLVGLRHAEAEHEITTGVIVCALRNLPLEHSMRMAEVAIAFRGRGVVGFDLAGAEHGHPPIEHEKAFQLAADANLPITVHAGEAFGPASIQQAIHYCNARRIGHGTRLWEDPDLLAYMNDFRIPIEICLTSNVQTHATSSLGEHPLRTYFDQGLIVSLSTDNRLMSGTSVADEYMHAHKSLGFTLEELCEIAIMGFESAFLPYQERATMVAAVREEIRGMLAQL